MDTVELMKLIKTTLKVRGGTEGDPKRVITQYWALDGKLAFEEDPIHSASDIEAARDIVHAFLNLPWIKQAAKEAVPGSQINNLIIKARVFVEEG